LVYVVFYMETVQREAIFRSRRIVCWLRLMQTLT